MVPPAPLHHAVLAIDVAASGGRDDQLLLRMRSDLREIIAGLLQRQGLEGSVDEWADLGDGVRLIMALGVTPVALLDPFVHNLDAALRGHRKAASESARLRLRMALHMGLLHRDGDGWAGAPLVHLARLIDADQPRDALRMTDEANLVVVLSEAVYEGLVRHGFGLDPAACRRVSMEAKDIRVMAWIHVPASTLVGLPAARQPHPAPQPARPRKRMRLVDPYVWRARLEPLMLCLLPVGLPLMMIAPTLPAWVALAVVPVLVLLPLAVDQLVRDRGQRVEARLHSEWGGPPSTQLLRWSGPTNEVRQVYLHTNLQRIIGPTIVLPAADEERQNPVWADGVYDAAVAVLRARARTDSPLTHLVQVENCNYGFRRNTFGLKSLGIALSLVGFAAGAWLALRTVAGWAVLLVDGALLMFWLFVVRREWVRRAARTYAQRLIETIEPATEAR
jgi:hypothetical protein